MKKLSFILLALLAISFIGCQKLIDFPEPEPEPEPDPEPIVEAVITLEDTLAVLHHGETYQINAECENPITYSSEKEYHATVSEEGLITANYVGSTVITLESEYDTKTLEVVIEPMSNLFPEPDIEIGESKESIIAKFGTPDAETIEAIGYQNYSENTTMLMVMFDEEGSVKLYALILGVDQKEELDVFFSERYMFAQEQEGVKMYLNALSLEEATLIAGSQVSEDELGEEYLMAFYMGNTSEPEEKSVNLNAVLKALVK